MIWPRGADLTSDGTATFSRRPVGSPLGVSQAGINNFVRTDAHGDVTATVSTAGAVTASRAFDPFGVVTGTGGTGAQPTVGYQSDWTDPTSGLVNMGARWYQPTSATFVSRDSYNGRVDTPVSLNRHTYANNNPVAYTDPTGRESKGPGTRCEDIGGCRVASDGEHGSSMPGGTPKARAKSTVSGNHNNCRADNCDRLRDQVDRQRLEAEVETEARKRLAILQASKSIASQSDPLLQLAQLIGVDAAAQAIANKAVAPIPYFVPAPLPPPSAQRSAPEPQVPNSRDLNDGCRGQDPEPVECKYNGSQIDIAGVLSAAAESAGALVEAAVGLVESGLYSGLRKEGPRGVTDLSVSCSAESSWFDGN